MALALGKAHVHTLVTVFAYEAFCKISMMQEVCLHKGYEC